MRIFLIVLTALSLMIGLSYAKEMTSATQTKLKGPAPKGVVIHKNNITVKQGYVVQKVSKTRAVARMRGGNGITGDFDCTCNGESGGCSVVTTPNSATCVSSGCNNCYMIITIPGTPKTLMRY